MKILNERSFLKNKEDEDEKKIKVKDTEVEVKKSLQLDKLDKEVFKIN